MEVWKYSALDNKGSNEWKRSNNGRVILVVCRVKGKHLNQEARKTVAQEQRHRGCCKEVEGAMGCDGRGGREDGTVRARGADDGIGRVMMIEV